MSEINCLSNVTKISYEIEEKADNRKKNKTKTKQNEILFFPVMDIKKKFKISNKFDKKHSEKLLEEKDKYLEVVELDDRLPEEIEEISHFNLSNIDPLNITFGM